MTKRKLSVLLIFLVVIGLMSISFTVSEEGNEEVNATNNETAYGPFVDSRILEKFENNYTEVRVIVDIRDTSGISISARDSTEEQVAKDKLRKDFLDNNTNAVLSKLSKADFKLRRKSPTGHGFSGNVTKEGLQKLANDTNVEAIRLVGVSSVQYGEGTIDVETKEGNVVSNDVGSGMKNITKNISLEIVSEEKIRKSLFSRFISFLKSLLKFK